MEEDTRRRELTDRAAAMAEGLDVLLAALLLAKRIHVENISLAGPGLATADLSGELIENGLGALAQVMTLTPQTGKREKKKQAEEEESGGDQPAAHSFWQALKDFALPLKAPSGKKKS